MFTSICSILCMTFALIIILVLIVWVLSLWTLITWGTFWTYILLLYHLNYHPQHLFLPLMLDISFLNQLNYLQERILLLLLKYTRFWVSLINKNLNVFLSRSFWYLVGYWDFSLMMSMNELIIFSTSGLASLTFMNCSYSRGTFEKLGCGVANYERQIRSYFFMLWVREGLYFYLLSYDSVYELVESINIFLNGLEPLLNFLPFGLKIRLQLINIANNLWQFLQRLFYS